MGCCYLFVHQLVTLSKLEKNIGTYYETEHIFTITWHAALCVYINW